jgi:hypothetical protein
MFPDAQQPFLAADRCLHIESFHFEQGLQRLANLGLIVNNEHRS